MILFRYTKIDGAEYIPHLDTLRHIIRTLVRAKISVHTSEGFHKHPKIFMSSPIGVGIKSLAEFCCVDTVENIEPEDFKRKFNENSPNGIKCEWCCFTENNANVASIIDSCEYKITGLMKIELDKLSSSTEFLIIDKNGRSVNVRDRIISARYEGDDLICVLKTGNENLRPDFFAKAICKDFDGEILKLKAFGVESYEVV